LSQSERGESQKGLRLWVRRCVALVFAHSSTHLYSLRCVVRLAFVLFNLVIILLEIREAVHHVVINRVHGPIESLHFMENLY
jgi:hypothetical protein